MLSLNLPTRPDKPFKVLCLGAHADDIENATNRSPYPTLHLLRADSITRAVQAFPDASAIYDTNIATLRRMGRVGWAQKMKEWA